MNVKLAVQTLSSGVADALDYLEKCQHPDFQGVWPTVTFIRYLDRAFDLLNSINKFAKGFKAPIRNSNIATIQSICTETSDYLRSLSVNGVPILNTPRNTLALGLITLLSKESSGCEYFLTYKISQDHLELFFACIRSRGGLNNNPNVLRTAVFSSFKKHSLKMQYNVVRDRKRSVLSRFLFEIYLKKNIEWPRLHTRFFHRIIDRIKLDQNKPIEYVGFTR